MSCFSTVLPGFPCGSAGEESAHNAGDLGLIPELGRSPGKGKGYPLQYSVLENLMDYTVHGVAKSQTRLSNFHTTGLPRWLIGQESACNAGGAREASSIPPLGGSPGEGNGSPLQCSCLENVMDRGAWWATVHQTAKGWTQLRD